jgi:hypothetical protein
MDPHADYHLRRRLRDFSRRQADLNYAERRRIYGPDKPTEPCADCKAPQPTMSAMTESGVFRIYCADCWQVRNALCWKEGGTWKLAAFDARPIDVLRKLIEEAA